VQNPLLTSVNELIASHARCALAYSGGISHRILEDCFSQEISNYWQELFDHDEFKEEIQRGR